MSILRWLAVIVFALATGVAGWMWTNQYAARQQSAAFLKLKDDIALIRNETVLDDDMIEVVRLPERFRDDLSGIAVPNDASYRSALLGERPVRDVPAGSLLLFAAFEPRLSGELAGRVTPGMRAMTISVTAASTVGYFVQPGSIVDLVGTLVMPPEGGEPVTLEQVETRTILQKVKVLAVGPARTLAEYQRLSGGGYSTITIEVSPKDAETLVFAMQQVNRPLTLMLRNPEDDSDVADSGVGWATLRQR